jgi:tyrosinase
VVRRGKPVPQWQRTAENAALAKRAVGGARGAKPFRVPPLGIAKSKLLLEPFAVPRERLLLPGPWLCERICTRRQLRVRKNQKDLTPIDWDLFLCALEAVNATGAASPTFAEFVDIHRRAMDTMAGMMWGAHTMASMGHDGRNFLAWHREYLAKLEARLMAVNPLVTIPYWNSVVDRAIPAALTGSAFLSTWGITRGTWAPTQLASLQVYNATMIAGTSPPDFAAFQQRLEVDVHNNTHRAVGGTMALSTSPADPIFWLHHAFIDKCWADWQRAHPTAAFNPGNPTEALQPTPIMTRSVSSVLSTAALGYVYAN